MLYSEPLQKRTHKGSFFNGGTDAFMFELLVKNYIFDLMTPETDKICNLIKTLNMVDMAMKG